MPVLDLITEAAQAIKEQLSSLLVDELGTLSNGSPAIWIGQVPNSLKTTGLQLEIQEAREGDVFPMANHQKYADQTWILTLINFAPSPDSALIVAKRKIESNFIQKSPAKYSPATDLALEKCKFFLWVPEILNKSLTVSSPPVSIDSRFWIATELDLSSPTYYYYGGVTPDSEWKINRFHKVSLAKESAMNSNNSSYSTLSSAWEVRSDLVYEEM